MADLNAGYILQGQSPDIIGQMMRGTEAARLRNQAGDENRLRALYAQQGAGIASGDQNALNALAGISPQAAMGIQQNRLGMEATRQDMGYQAETMQMKREEMKQRAAEYAKTLSAAEAAQKAAEVKRGLAAAMSAKTPQEWDQIATQFGAPELAGQFDNRQAVINSYMDIADVLEAQKPGDPTKGAPEGTMWVDPGNYGAGVRPIAGFTPEPKDEYGRYARDETTAGRAPLGRLEYEQAKKGDGITMTTNPDGTTTTTIGGKGKGAQPGRVSYSPLEVKSVLDSIDAISGDPALSRVVGPVVGGGGNNIDDLSAPQRLYYGGDGTALVERIGQLQNTTWLIARDMLKGGGSITDYESRKAEGAMSRLSRAKGLPEFNAALKDLRDAITEGEAKLQAAQGGGAATAPADGQGSQQDLSPEMKALMEKYQ